MALSSLLESILFVSDKPLSIKKLALLASAPTADIEREVELLQERYDAKSSGIVLIRNEDRVQFTTNPEHAETIRLYLHEDTTGELTRPALETLSVVSYRGPVTKTEIEEIRGVNCSLALRNLSIRGLIDAKDDPVRGEKVYSVSFDFLRHLGVSSLEELPEYSRLNQKTESYVNQPQDQNESL